MTNEDDANNAIEELTGTLLKGSRMRVEKSTGVSRPGGGRGGGGGKMGRGGARGGRGRGGDMGGRAGRGDRGGGRDPYPPHPYYRPPYDPYDPYDRYPPSPRDRLDERRLYALEAERRLLEDRYPPAQRDRYAASLGRYPMDRYPYDDPRLPPDPREDLYARRAAALDRYGGYMERPPPDYYARARRAEAESGGYGDREASNGYAYGGGASEYREKPTGAAMGSGAGAGNPQTFSSTYSSYYDRFYKSNGAGGQGQPKSLLSGGSGASAMAGASAANQFSQRQSVPGKKPNEQAFLQTGPIFF